MTSRMTHTGLKREIAAWQEARSATQTKARWMFRVSDARRALGKSDPAIPSKEIELVA